MALCGAVTAVECQRVAVLVAQDLNLQVPGLAQKFSLASGIRWTVQKNVETTVEGLTFGVRDVTPNNGKSNRKANGHEVELVRERIFLGGSNK